MGVPGRTALSEQEEDCLFRDDTLRSHYLISLLEGVISTHTLRLWRLPWIRSAGAESQPGKPEFRKLARPDKAADEGTPPSSHHVPQRDGDRLGASQARCRRSKPASGGGDENPSRRDLKPR